MRAFSNLSKIQDNAQCRVEPAHLFETETAHALAESSRFDGCGLFGKDARDTATDLDFGPEACRAR